jgi:hypothetical protein
MLQTSGTDITGVTGIMVGTDTFDATFHDGSFAELYAADPTSVYSSAFASDATTALFSYIDTLPLTSYPAGSFIGCSSTDNCYLTTAFAFADSVVATSAVYISDTGYHEALTPFAQPLDGSVNFNNLTYTTWQSQAPVDKPPEAVAEPPIAILIASGLIAFGMTRRKRRA